MHIKIAFIDDGINPEFIPAGVAFENYSACETEVKVATPVSDVSHGTMCYQIFRDHLHSQYRLVSIKVLDNATGTGNHKALVNALNWCAEQDIDIINMSMGTRQFTDFALVSRAIARLSNTVIVAACSNSNNLTFPACLPNVIGVRHCEHEELRETYKYLENPYDQIEVLTCVNNVPISFGDNNTMNMSGANSFAAPLITARVLEYMAKGYSKENIRRALKKDAVKDINFCTFDFFKSLFHKWEEVNIPIVVLPDSTDTAPQKLKDLLNVFIHDGYRAIALSKCTETSASDFIYSLNWHGADKVSIEAFIELYYNFALPDIIFLQMGMKDAVALPEGMQPDVVLKPQGAGGSQFSCWDEGSVLDYGERAEILFSQITRLLE